MKRETSIKRCRQTLTSRSGDVWAARHGGGLVLSQVAGPNARADKVAQLTNTLAGCRTAQLVLTRQRGKQRLQQRVHVPLEHL